jgi:YVTN family beta-propeller protein
VLPACSWEQPPPAAAEGTGGQLLVTNERSGDLSVIDLATERVVATVPLGKRPRGIRISPDLTVA